MNKSAIKAGIVSAVTFGLVFIGFQVFNSYQASPSTDPKIEFAQMMIPHHEQAVEMAELALLNTSTPSVVSIAEKIIAEQKDEISLMSSWLDAANIELEDSTHHGHDSGMLSSDQMAALQTSKQMDFDQLFVQGMIQHHEGAIEMARAVLDSNDQELRDLATVIIAVQKIEIEELQALIN